MEENQPKTGKFAWTFGLILGLASVAFSFMLYTMDMHYEQTTPVRVIGLVMMVAVIVLATLQFKKANSGFLKLSDALKLGAGIGLISGLISLAYFALLTNVIEPDFMDKATEIAKIKTFEDNPQITEEQWQQGVEIQKSFAWLMYPIMILVSIIFGLVIGLVTGLFMKKQKPAY